MIAERGAIQANIYANLRNNVQSDSVINDSINPQQQTENDEQIQQNISAAPENIENINNQANNNSQNSGNLVEMFKTLQDQQYRNMAKDVHSINEYYDD